MDVSLVDKHTINRVNSNIPRYIYLLLFVLLFGGGGGGGDDDGNEVRLRGVVDVPSYSFIQSSRTILMLPVIDWSIWVDGTDLTVPIQREVGSQEISVKYRKSTWWFVDLLSDMIYM
jgi:hypothetical protein